MNRLIYFAIIIITGLSSTAAIAADPPLDQSKIISVRPSFPDGAKAFVEQQKKIERDRQKKPLLGNWFRKKPSQPAGYGYQAPPPPAPKQSSGRSFWDIFHPAKWGKGKGQTNTNSQQARQTKQMRQIQQNEQPEGTQQGGEQPPAWNQSVPGQGQPAFPQQMPPPDMTAPTSQPGFGG